MKACKFGAKFLFASSHPCSNAHRKRNIKYIRYTATAKSKRKFHSLFLPADTVAEIQAFIWGSLGLRFSDKIASWIMSYFK